MTSLKRSHATTTPTTTLSSKTYLRTLRSGKVQKIVRELYLRQDIPCSSQLCTSCLEQQASGFHKKAAPFVLSATPAATKQFPQGHYLVPDTNALLNGMDLFEAEGAFTDVIVLQTVLEEVKNRSLPLYHRLIALTKNDAKRFYVFFNEFRLETYVQREAGETINDRNDRTIRRACAWYSEHLQEAVKGRKSARCPAVVMISDDRDNIRKGKAENVTAHPLRDYVSQLPEADKLLDMIPERSSTRDGKAELFYPDYMSMSAMLTGVKAGTLHQGIFNVSTYNYLEGSVHVPAFDRQLIIQGRENSNRAVSGDVVVVEVLPKSEWKAPSSKVIEEDEVNKNENADNEDESEGIVTEQERRALQEEVKKTHSAGLENQPRPTCRVVGIVKRNWRQYVGHIDRDSVRGGSKNGQAQQTVFLIPMDKKVPKIRVRTRQAASLLGKRVLVAVDSWGRDSRYPVGHFVRSLGELESKGAETEALLLEWDVQFRPFPKTVLDCLPAEGHDWKVPASIEDPGWKGRRDLRDKIVCSIDPPGAKDLDDALHAKKLPNGNFEVGVHIADVSNFVRPNNAMDKEASLRGTTVYLVDKRIDMLPHLLGTDLCSLKPYVERFAFSVIWELDPDECVEPSNPFFNTLVRILATRCMMSAEYFCAGTLSPPEFRHYGLASEIYTHRTSPIRRYADLEVHRQLAAAIDYEPLDASLQSRNKLEGVCRNINFRHRNAQQAGRASVEFYVGQALKGRVIEEDGFVMRIFSNGFVVFVPRFGIEGLIRLKDLTGSERDEVDGVFDQAEYKLEFDAAGKGKRAVELFQKVKVRIEDELEVSTGKRKIKLNLI